MSSLSASSDKTRARVKFASFQWATGDDIVALDFSLGSAEKASTCRITLSDSFNTTAAALINHSLTSGGIAPLQSTNQYIEPSLPSIVPERDRKPADDTSIVPNRSNMFAGVLAVNGGLGTVNSMASTGGVFTPAVKAFLDTVASRESNAGSTDFAKSYYSRNNLVGGGFFDPSELQKSRSQINGYGNYIGRYQMGKLGEVEAKRRFNIPAMRFTPMEQDIMAYQKLIVRGALKPLAAGDIRTALQKVSNEWAVIPGGSIHQPQPGATIEFFMNYYAQRLAFYQGGKPAPKVSSIQTVSAPSPTVTSTALPVVKGSPIVIEVDGNIFEYLHQATETSDNGLTIISGVGVAWKTSRKKRSATYRDISLKQVATYIASIHKLKLDYQSKTNPVYKHLDQSGVSDYALLLRECTEYGLMMSDAKGVLVIKDVKGIKLSGDVSGNESDDGLLSDYVLERGKNIISFNISDRASGGNDDDTSQYLPSDSKSFIDPISGKVIGLQKDVVSDSSNRLTGKTKNAPTGVLKEGQNAKALTKGKLKRIAGLPSTFVIPLTSTSLRFNPLEAVVTKGLPDILSRIWVIKTVKHDIGENRTTLELMSPVETLDIMPSQAAPKAKPSLTASSGKQSVGFIYPVTGTVTSLQGLRNGKAHNGVDIGGDAREGSPIYAAADGVIVVNSFQAGGAGYYCQMKHPQLNLFTSYLHQQFPCPLAVGTVVKQGDRIGTVGNTGGSRGAHLHLEVLSSVAPAVRLQVTNYFPKLNARLNTIIAKTIA